MSKESALLALSKVREEINGLDEVLVLIYAKRFKLVMEVVVPAKLEAGLLLYDSGREIELLNKVRSLAQEEGLPEHMATKIWRSMIDTFLSEEIRRTNGGGDTMYCPDCGFLVNINDQKFNPRISKCPIHDIDLIGSKPKPTSET